MLGADEDFVTEFLDLVEKTLPGHLRDVCVGAVIDGLSGVVSPDAQGVAGRLSEEAGRRRWADVEHVAAADPQQEFWYMGGAAL